MRPGMILLGIGLGILWLVGLEAHTQAWIAWSEFGLACLSILSVLAPDRMLRALRAGPFVLGAALLGLWLGGLALAVQAWMVWWTFAFALAYLLFGVAAAASEPSAPRYPTARTV